MLLGAKGSRLGARTLLLKALVHLSGLHRAFFTELHRAFLRSSVLEPTGARIGPVDIQRRKSLQPGMCTENPCGLGARKHSKKL